MFKSKKMKKIFSLVIIALMLFSHPIYPVTLDNNTNIVQQDSAAESDEVVADESLGFDFGRPHLKMSVHLSIRVFQ